MKKIGMFVFVISCMTGKSMAQGCVAIRSIGGMCTMDHNQTPDSIPTKWLLNINNRYFNSFRHYVGTEEQKQRVELGTQVINHAFTADFALTHILNNRWSVMMDVPILYNTRSSLYEHGGKERHTTSSYGIGDIRLAVYKWMLNPSVNNRFNFQVGLGLKLPTGDYRYQDRFYTATTGVTAMGPVDQSIQLGDGGLGFTTEINTYYKISPAISLYGNFYYLINPREHNGVSTARGGTSSAATISYGSDVMSVPDQYLVRGGVNVVLNRFVLTAGLRKECIPVNDLIGGSNGFRRPGYILSGEPGISYRFKKWDIYSFVPIALSRNRTQSVPDKIRTAMTGTYAQGDAAFADYVVNIGCSIRF